MPSIFWGYIGLCGLDLFVDTFKAIMVEIGTNIVNILCRFKFQLDTLKGISIINLIESANILENILQGRRKISSPHNFYAPIIPEKLPFST